LQAVIILRRPELQRAVRLLLLALEDRADQLRRRFGDAVLALEGILVGRDEAGVVTAERCLRRVKIELEKLLEHVRLAGR
jgi:hypothetical protein